MKCEKCGCEAPERAVICPECGEILPRLSAEKTDAAHTQETIPDGFSIPYLSASADTAAGSAEDPHKISAEQQIKRNIRKRRIVFSSVAVVVILAVVLYIVFLSGYKLAAFRYIKGVDYSSGSMYLALVPDSYMDYLETTYETTRRDVKESVSDYFVSWNKNYGNEGRMSYDITKKQSLNVSEIEELEDELKQSYNITVEISKAVAVNFSVDDGGERASEKATFVKIGAKWCCMEAMEQIDYVCQYDGYGQW